MPNNNINSYNELMIKIHENLFISNYKCVINKDNLIANEIKSIISLSKKKINDEHIYDDVYYHMYNIDINSLNYNSFILMLKIIKKSLSKKKSILIQCDNGISSSLLVVLFYLSIIENSLNMYQIYDWITRKFPITNNLDDDKKEIILSKLTNFRNMYNDDILFNNYCDNVLEKI